jgi:hypothetical protein
MNVLRKFRRSDLLHILVTALTLSFLVLPPDLLLAAPPAWWQERGVVEPGAVADDFAAINQGQLKNLAMTATLEMNARLPGGAGSDVIQMLTRWRSNKTKADDFAAVTFGQLKSVAAPFYARLIANGQARGLPWNPVDKDHDDEVANIGQAKNLFAFLYDDSLPLRSASTNGTGTNGTGTNGTGTTKRTLPGLPIPVYETLSYPPWSPVDDSVPWQHYKLQTKISHGSGSHQYYRYDYPGGPYESYTGAARSMSNPGLGTYPPVRYEPKSDGALASAIAGCALDSDFYDNGPPFDPAGYSWDEWLMNNSWNILEVRSFRNHESWNWTDQDGYWAETYDTWGGERKRVRISLVDAGPDAELPVWVQTHRDSYALNAAAGTHTHSVVTAPFVLKASDLEQADIADVTSKHWVGQNVREVCDAKIILPQVLEVNDGDSDGNGVPDFADGMEFPLNSPLFHEVNDATRVSASMKSVGVSGTPGKKVRFTYPSADPMDMTISTDSNGTRHYNPGEGALRLWKDIGDADTPRKPASVKDGGDFIPSGVWLDYHTCFSGSPLYFAVESVALSQERNDQHIVVEYDNDGDGPELGYVVDECVITSISTHIKAVSGNNIGSRAELMQPSLPNPTITLSGFQVQNSRLSNDKQGLVADIIVAGEVLSAASDLVDDADTGAIKWAYASVNGVPHEQSIASLSVQKGGAGSSGSSIEHPYPYKGTLNKTMTAVPVTEGRNTYTISVRDPVYHLTGTATVSFEIIATPPVGSSSTISLQLPFEPRTPGKAPFPAILNVSDSDLPFLTNVKLYEEAGGAIYRSTINDVSLRFGQPPVPPVLSAAQPDVLDAILSLGVFSWKDYALPALTETGPNTRLFTWQSSVDDVEPYQGWTVEVGQVDPPESTPGGEFHPYAVNLRGPAALLSQLKYVHMMGKALPVTQKDGQWYAADPEHTDRPLAIVSVTASPVQVPDVDPPPSSYQWDDETDGELDPDSEDLRKELTHTPAYNVDQILSRLDKYGKTYLNDMGSAAFYKGYAYGFFDNPISNAKDTVSSIWGIGKTAIKTGFELSPLGVVWEFTFGDRYATEIKTATKFANRVVDGAKSGYDFVTKYGPTVLDFLWKLTDQADEATVKLALSGEIPGKDQLGPELRTAVEVSAMLLVMAVDAWTGLDSYHRGYWVGYITFEVVAAVIAAAATAPAGGEGAIALLARHVPKLETLMEMIKPMLTALQEVPQLAKLLEKVTEFGGKMSKIGPFCFVKGTPVLTVKGLKPIEQIKPWDWVWSRSEDGLRWGWRPVIGTFVTHPAALVHVRYAAKSRHGACSGEEDRSPLTAFSSPDEAEIISTAGHPFHVERAGGFSDFVAAGELRSEDRLTLADGAEAVVTDVSSQQASEGALFTTYNFTVADHHTYFAGRLPVWVHNRGLSECDELGKYVNKLVVDLGDNPEKYFEYLLKARKDVSGTVKEARVWGNGQKQVTKKMVDAFAERKIADVSKLPTVNQLNNMFREAANLEKIAKADMQVHHIVPESVLKIFKRLEALPEGHSLGDVPGLALSIKDHRAISDVMNPWMRSEAFTSLKTAEKKAQAVVQWYRDHGYNSQAEVANAWLKLMKII